MPSEGIEGDEWVAYVTLDTYDRDERGIAYRARALWRRSARSSRRSDDLPGRTAAPSTGRRGTGDRTRNNRKVCEMQNAETVLGVLRERGRRGLPCDELYRQLFNPQLYLLAYGRIYSNHGAMTPGVTSETADGMSLGKIDQIIETMRHERYRFRPARRVNIPKGRSRKLRPLGLPTWSDKVVGEVVRLLLEAYYEPQFSDRSHGFRPRRGCHTALREVVNTWRGTSWFIEGDLADCFGSLDHQIMLAILAERSTITGSCGCCVTCWKPDTWRTGNGTLRSPVHRRAESLHPSSPIFT
jgi:hypothetical protein